MFGQKRKPAITSVHQILIAAFSISLVASCATGRTSGWDARPEAEQSKPPNRSQSAIAEFKSSDPSIQHFFDKAQGYAVFPNVGKGGIAVGGSFGKGDVFEGGKVIGRASITQLTVGFQLGGQAFRQIIFFRDKAALDHFTSGNFALSAQASAVAITAGVSATTKYSEGVAIFTLPIGGLMYEAAVGGQKISFEPARSTQPGATSK